MSRRLFPGNRNTFVILLDKLRRGYSYEFWDTLMDYGKEKDINLLIIPIDEIVSNELYSYQHNNMINFIEGIQIDGIISLNNTISDQSKLYALDQFLKKFSHIPIVSIASSFSKSLTTLYCDNKQSTKRIMDHLIVDHGCKKIAFIMGLMENVDAQIRFTQYKESLKEHNITYDNAIVYYGDWLINSGEKAIAYIYDDLEQRPDAIFACNDDMAIGACMALEERGIKVPNDIPVIGFDDVKMIRLQSPPLTTMRQPLDVMAKNAVDSLLDHLDGKPVEKHQYFDPQFIIRKSCGCDQPKSGSRDNESVQAINTKRAFDVIIKDQTSEYLMVDALLGISQTKSTKEMLSVIEGALKEIDVKTCFISYYNQEDTFSTSLPQKATLKLGYIDDQVFDITDNYYDTADVLPSDISLRDGASTYVIAPLFYNDASYGYMFYEIGIRFGSLYESIRRHISSAIQMTRILRERNNALVELNQTQEQLIFAEKMASLGSLVAGVAHEVNTPIGVSVSAASVLKCKSEELKAAYTNGKIRKDDFEKYIDINTETTNIILLNLESTADLINSFKNISADQVSGDLRTINVSEYIAQLLHSLKPELTKRPIEVKLMCDESITLNTYPGGLSQVLTNLILNSLIHGFESRNEGNITILVTESSDNQLSIIYTDDGKGIEAGYVDRVFEPFYTTKRGLGGSGLGLHIVYNIVRQNLKGRITCSSEIDSGVVFDIKIPNLK